MKSSLSQQIKQSLSVSWIEGIPAAVMIGIMDYYVVPFGLFLGATTQAIGMLVSLPQLLGALSLLFAANAVQWVGSRLTFVVRGAALQAALLVPVALLAIVPTPSRIVWLIVLIAAYRVLFNLIGPAWGSLMSDYLPAEHRGRYFGGRSRVVGIAQVAGMGVAGLTLFVTNADAPAAGFCAVFLAASMARFLSAKYLAQMTDLAVRETPGSEFTLVMFLKRFRESNFVRFVVYVAAIVFSTFVAAPYFSVFMLRDLRFDYLTYTVIHLAATIASILAFPVWGRHADLIGNVRVLKMTGALVPVIPFLWLLSTHPVYLIAVEVFSGFAWGGFNLCATNFIYDAVTPAKRVRCLGYFNLINGVAIFAGATLGGYLADHLPPVAGYRILTLMALSGVLRLAAHRVFAPRFEEIRASSRRVSSAQLFFSVVGIRPLVGELEEGLFWRRLTAGPVSAVRRQDPSPRRDRRIPPTRGPSSGPSDATSPHR